MTRALNQPDLTPSPELSYMLGAFMGDGYAYSFEGNYCVWFRVKDKEFAKTFSNALSSVMRRQKPYPIINVVDGMYLVAGYSKILYELLKGKQLMQEIRELVKVYPADFLRGLSDAEGSVYYMRRWNRPDVGLNIKITNSSEGLIKFAKELLNEFGIESSIRAVKPRDTTIRGKLAHFTKNYYNLIIRKRESIVKFEEQIGFSIRRKMMKLKEWIRRERP